MATFLEILSLEVYIALVKVAQKFVKSNFSLIDYLSFLKSLMSKKDFSNVDLMFRLSMRILIRLWIPKNGILEDIS